ncbi:hypothetical protein [Archangium violaceum]|uniref:hypothetical protein n=1 Tax=Archangium violaceum TaxID=83451 RepID=UPI0037C01B07
MTQSSSWRRPGSTGEFPALPNQFFRNEHFSVYVDERMRLVRTVRSDKPFASLTEFERVFTELGEALDRLDRQRYVILADVRAAPGRNDPDFEAALLRMRPRWLGGFRKVGVLVQTTVGVMQIQRYARQDGIKRLVTIDEAEILRYFSQAD